MAKQTIDIGVQGNDGTGDSIRAAFKKTNENFNELYAVFGEGGQIGFTDLNDTPASYSNNQILITNSTGTAIVTKFLASGAGITIDNSSESTLTISSTSSALVAESNPSLGGGLNGNGFAIANVAEPSIQAATLWNSIHGTPSVSITLDDIVITKGYADRRYVQQTAVGATNKIIRVRSEPIDTSEFVKTISSWASGNAVVLGHNMTSSDDGMAFRYNATVTPATGLLNGTTYYTRFVDDDTLGIYPTANDAKAGTNRIIVPNDGSGVQTLTDTYLDPALSGNWASNEAMPRDAIVRRQGDTMEGFLTLHADPTSAYHAATKQYIDNLIGNNNQISELTDVTITSATNNQLLIFNNSKWVNGTASGDVTVSYSAPGVITTTIGSLVIDNDNISNSAGIVQSKLSLNNSSAASTAGTSTKGIASFDSANFETDGAGWVGIKNGGVALIEIANIDNDRILGNLTGNSTYPREISTNSVVVNGLNGIGTGNGAVVRTGTGTYSVTTVTTTGESSSIVKTDASGNIDVVGIKLNSSSGLILERSSNTLNLRTPGGIAIISAEGSLPGATPVTLQGQFTLGASSTLVASSANSVEWSNVQNKPSVWAVSITGDVTGSVFADDSSVLVDGANGKIVGPVDTDVVNIAHVLTMTPLTAAPTLTTAGIIAVADGITWDPATKTGSVPYPVFYDGVAWHALY